jgi:hypothetical protein
LTNEETMARVQRLFDATSADKPLEVAAVAMELAGEALCNINNLAVDLSRAATAMEQNNFLMSELLLLLRERLP